MATYGKKKKSILPSFSVLRDSTTRSSTDKPKRRASTAYTTSALHGNDLPLRNHSQYDDSIEEMASMLLEDTVNDQLSIESGKVLPQIGTARLGPGMASSRLQGSKTLPELPQLIFNGDDAWAFRTSPVVVARGDSNEVFSTCDNTAGATNLHTLTKQLRTDSLPEIPRRSSRRNSARPNHSSTERETAGPVVPMEVRAIDAGARVNKQIEAMLAATKALKPSHDNTLFQGPYVPVKKRRLKDNKVFTKVKTAINDRLQAKNSKKRHDSSRDDSLLEHSSSMSQTPDVSFAPSPTVSSVERRLNEGDNLKNPKIYSLTGHSNVRRKQVADDGKSLRSRKSVSDDPFSERPDSSSMSRTATRFENRLYDDMSIDHATELISDLPSQSHEHDELSQPRSKKARQSYIATGPDFDAFFSSSPLGQSTPRIRLEPTFEEDDRKILIKVPADSRSLFDLDIFGPGQYSDMDIDTSPITRDNELRNRDPKRKGARTRHGTSARPRSSNRTKKHPSPSKAELEGLERALNQFGRSDIFGHHEDISSAEYAPLPTTGILASMDANTKLTEPNRRDKGKGFGMFLKPDLTRTTTSVPSIPKHGNTHGPSKIPKPAEKFVSRIRLEARPERRFSAQLGKAEKADGSHMDVDELQWDQTALMGRV